MLELYPVTLKAANEYVKEHHRHHGVVVGHKFSIGATKDGMLVGVAICGRPVSRFLDDGYTLEITRLCTDGTPDVGDSATLKGKLFDGAGIFVKFHCHILQMPV